MDAIIVLFVLRAAEGQGSDVSGRRPKPIGPGEVARAFAGSPETVRRRLRRLVDAGICQRSGSGYVVPPTVVEDVLLPRMAGPSQLNLRRLFRQVAAVSAEDEREHGTASAVV
jgi:alkanesulfonate monooxygenase SsuD/methylene tetrahydromethanopterin reductase-like flavin-dependent oxidoreductase (luciferase family)